MYFYLKNFIFIYFFFQISFSLMSESYYERNDNKNKMMTMTMMMIMMMMKLSILKNILVQFVPWNFLAKFNISSIRKITNVASSTGLIRTSVRCVRSVHFIKVISKFIITGSIISIEHNRPWYFRQHVAGANTNVTNVINRIVIRKI